VRVRASFVAIYATAYASLWLALLTPATITLALRVSQIAPVNATRATSWIVMAGALVALLSNPILGAFSDRTRSRFGRRRPYLLAGTAAGLAGLALIGVTRSLGAVLLGWCLAQLAYNAVLTAMVAIVADRIPASQRGTVVGILGICMPVGQIVGTFLVQQLVPNLLLALLVPGALGAIGACMLSVALPDGVDPASQAAADVRLGNEDGASAGARKRRFSLAHHRDFAWAWLSRVLFVVGSVSFQTYQPFLLLNALRFDATQVPALVFRSTLVQAVTTVLSSLIAGRISDRLGRRKAIAMVGAVLQGMGLWLVALAQSYATLLSAVAVAGLGRGIYEGVNLALVTDVLPNRDLRAAQYLGVLNIANALPQVLAPLAAPAILESSRGNYTLLFLLAGTISVSGAAVLLPVRAAR
jgi:MFS family permease